VETEVLQSKGDPQLTDLAIKVIENYYTYIKNFFDKQGYGYSFFGNTFFLKPNIGIVNPQVSSYSFGKLDDKDCYGKIAHNNPVLITLNYDVRDKEGKQLGLGNTQQTKTQTQTQTNQVVKQNTNYSTQTQTEASGSASTSTSTSASTSVLQPSRPESSNKLVEFIFKALSSASDTEQVQQTLTQEKQKQNHESSNKLVEFMFNVLKTASINEQKHQELTQEKQQQNQKSSNKLVEYIFKVLKTASINEQGQQELMQEHHQQHQESSNNLVRFMFKVLSSASNTERGQQELIQGEQQQNQKSSNKLVEFIFKVLSSASINEQKIQIRNQPQPQPQPQLIQHLPSLDVSTVKDDMEKPNQIKDALRNIEVVFLDFDKTISDNHTGGHPFDGEGYKINKLWETIFEKLQEKGINIVINTRGIQTDVEKVMNTHFGEFGIEVYGATDENLIQKVNEIGVDSDKRWAKLKTTYIDSYIKEKKIGKNQVLFLDDTPQNIQHAFDKGYKYSFHHIPKNATLLAKTLANILEITIPKHEAYFEPQLTGEYRTPGVNKFSINNKSQNRIVRTEGNTPLLQNNTPLGTRDINLSVVGNETKLDNDLPEFSGSSSDSDIDIDSDSDSHESEDDWTDNEDVQPLRKRKTINQIKKGPFSRM